MREQVPHLAPRFELGTGVDRFKRGRYFVAPKTLLITTDHPGPGDLLRTQARIEGHGIDHRSDEVEAVVEAFDAAETFDEEREEKPLLSIPLWLRRRRGLI